VPEAVTAAFEHSKEVNVVRGWRGNNGAVARHDFVLQSVIACVSILYAVDGDTVSRMRPGKPTMPTRPHADCNMPVRLGLIVVTGPVKASTDNKGGLRDAELHLSECSGAMRTPLCYEYRRSWGGPCDLRCER